MEGMAQVMWLFDHGQTVDHFRVLRPLGKGGMAQVFLARDTKLGRKVALKVVQPEAIGSEQAVERFLFEARATAKFNHPNIVTIHFVGETDHKPYVALEYVEGQTLRQRLEQEQLSIFEAVRLGQAIAGALVEAHGAGIIHRDLKPDNVMLGRDGRVRVMDFGLARLFTRPEGEAEALAETVAPESVESEQVFESAGGIRGTPAYMAPEQWRDQGVSEAADIWALGVVLYEMLAGQRPYIERTPVQQAIKVCDEQPAPRIEEHRSDLPERLLDLIHRCLEKNAEKRPAATEVAAELGQLLSPGREQRQDACPFRGLLPFGEQHAALFFGRETEVAAFLERLRDEPLMPVVGPSGSGKSSFVQAGIIPRLREAGPLTVWPKAILHGSCKNPIWVL
jgi:serine/threonine protein kinase